MDRKVIRSVVWDYIIITVGALLYVVAWTSFLIPNGIASGGLTGACTIIEMATRGLIPVGWSFPALNALLIIIATLILGKGFGFRTIYAILVSTLLFDVMPKVDVLLSLPGHLLYLDEKILVPVIGGIVEAIGIGLILSRGGSTGGTDIFAMIINKFWPITIGRFYLMADFVVITLLMFVPGHNFTNVVYGYVTMGVCAYVLDLIMLGKDSTVQVLIFSDKIHQIGDFITRDLGRGVTALKAVGWYTQSEKKVLLVLARKSQLHEITKAVKGVDPKAFMSVSPASDVYGEGFEEIKTGIDRKKKA